MYRFLLSARWIGFAVFVLVLAAVCTRLGFWQFHRLEHRLDQNKVITAHLKAEPIDLSQALPPGDKVDEDSEFTRVRATGTYDVEHQVTVKFTTRDGAPGVDVVTPLVLPSGQAVLVDRGWQESANTVSRPDVPAPPSGEVTVTGWLRQDNGAGGDAVRPINGQIRAISSIGFAKSVPYDLLGGYLNLRSEDPPPAQSWPRSPSRNADRAALLLCAAMVVLRPAGGRRLLLVRQVRGQGASQPHTDRRVRDLRARAAGQANVTRSA